MLKKKAKPLFKDELATEEFKALIDKMKRALEREKYGVALAAPQIGESKQVFIVSENVLPEGEKIFINPKIIKHSKKKENKQEGCLSVKGYYGEVPRYKQVTIEFLNTKGEKKTLGASGFLAQIFQHEIDHLNGILYIEKATELFRVDEDFNRIDDEK